MLAYRAEGVTFFFGDLVEPVEPGDVFLESPLVGSFGPSGDDLDCVITSVLLDLGGELFGLGEKGLFLRPFEVEALAVEHRLHAGANILDVLDVQGLQGGDLACVGLRVEVKVA